MLGEAESNRLAYTTGPACHQRHFVVQTKPAHSYHLCVTCEMRKMFASTLYLA